MEFQISENMIDRVKKNRYSCFGDFYNQALGTLG